MPFLSWLWNLLGRKGSRQGKVKITGKGTWEDIGALKAWLRDELARIIHGLV